MADNETPADDLRSLLSAAVDESAANAVADTTVAAKPDADVAAEKPDAADTSKDAGRERGPDGKFLKKDGDDKAVAKAADDKTADKDAAASKDATKADAKNDGAADDKAADKSSEAKVDDKAAPANWSASDKAMFNLQTPEARDFLLRRHKAMEADYNKKTAAVADLKKEFEPIQQMFAPHLDVLKAKGLTPAATIRAWANVETALANGRGVDIVKGMVESYGIDKAALGRVLGFTSTTGDQPSTDAAKTAAATVDAASTAHQPIQLPPELTKELRDLRARLDAQENEKRASQTSAAAEREAKVETEITNFKSAKKENGELQHPFYDEVEPAMIALARSYVVSKQPLPPLSELYETAVWANPSTRAAMKAAETAALEAKRTEEARAKAASARRAGSSVTGAPGSGQATSQIRGERTTREELEEAYAALT